MRYVDQLISLALWQITARNWMGWPTERRHRLTGEYEHIRYNETVKWQPGRLPYIGGPYGSR